MPRGISATTLRVTRRELATILAALRFYQDRGFQGGRAIPGLSVEEIATDGGLLRPLGLQEIDKLCQCLNAKSGGRPPKGLLVEPPGREIGPEPLLRVVYAIDVNAVSPQEAARQAYQTMADPESQPPVLAVIDHRGRITSIDLSHDEAG